MVRNRLMWAIAPIDPILVEFSNQLRVMFTLTGAKLLTQDTLHAGLTVKIQYPDYAAGKLGTLLTEETERDGKPTGYWLVQVIGVEMVLALLPEECTLLD